MISTLAVVAVPALAIRLLHGVAHQPWFRIDYQDPMTWLERTSLTDAVTAIARVAALTLAYYLVATTLLHLAAMASGSRRLISVTSPLTLPLVRRLADRVVAGSVAIGALVTPLLASTPATEVRPDAVASAEIVAGYLPPSRILDTTDITQPDTQAERQPDTMIDAAAFIGRPTTPRHDIADEKATRSTTRSDPPTGAGSVVVERGDHLWGLAEKRIQQALGRPPLDHEVAPYWRSVLDENRDRIKSGNPDVIHTGETIMLPDPAPFIPSGS